MFFILIDRDMFYSNWQGYFEWGQRTHRDGNSLLGLLKSLDFTKMTGTGKMETLGYM